MIPDVRKYEPHTPPLPNWLKWVYFGTVGVVVLSIGGYFAAWQNASSRMSTVNRKVKEIEKAKAEIRSNDARVQNLESSRQIRDSREQWAKGSTRLLSIEIALQLAVIEAEKNVQKIVEENARKEPRTGRRRNRAPTTKNIPDLVLSSIISRVSRESKSPEVVIEISHNVESRMLLTQLHSILTNINPDGYKLLNFRPEERPQLLTLSTTWTQDR